MNNYKAEDRYLKASLEFEGVLRACLHRYARNAADVDELLQETYAHLLTAGAAKGREEVRSIRAFALTVARNIALSWLRHRQVVPIELVADLEALELLDETGQVDEIVNTHQELALLTAAVASLPNRCRQVFTLRKVYGLSQKEIAAELSISENTVEQHLAKGMRLCSAALANSPMAERRSPWLERARRRAQRADELSAQRADELSAQRADELSAQRADELSVQRADELSVQRADELSAERTPLAAQRLNNE